MSADYETIYAGYLFRSIVALQIQHDDGTTTPFTLTGGVDIVESVVCTADGKTILTTPEISDHLDADADWANGVVVIEVPSAETAKLVDADLESLHTIFIKATKDGEPTPFRVSVIPYCAPLGTAAS